MAVHRKPLPIPSPRPLTPTTAPATGEATSSGPATVDVKDGGAGVRFNFPGTGAYRPIEWDEWFENFDRHQCAFVFDNDASTPLSSRYRIVKAAEWKEFLR